MKSDNQSYYDAFSEHYDARRHEGYHKLLDDQAAALVRRVGEGKDVLEVGCGTGLILQRVASFARSAQGIDLSPGMLERARARGLRVEQADATALPFDDQRFDVVCSFKVLAHVPDWERCLEEMVRVLRPGGYLIIDIYNRLSLRFLLKRLLGPKPIASDLDESSISTRFWSLSDAQRKLPEQLELLQVSGLRALPLLPLLMKLPPLRAGLSLCEQTLMDSPLARFAGFLVLTLKKPR